MLGSMGISVSASAPMAPSGRNAQPKVQVGIGVAMGWQMGVHTQPSVLVGELHTATCPTCKTQAELDVWTSGKARCHSPAFS